MLTRRALLAAVPALAACAAPCGPTNPPQPGLVHIGRLDMGQDLHGSNPDLIFERWARDMVPHIREMARRT